MVIEMELEKLMGYKNKWFVLHHKSLYDENPNLIGFRDPNEWSMIRVGDLVVYYQAGSTQLRGIYEVIRTGKNIDPTFGKDRTVFSSGELQHQHEMKILKKIWVKFHQQDAQSLSFHEKLNNPIRWDFRRVFHINNNDLKYILSL